MTNLAEITLYEIKDVANFLGLTIPVVNRLCRERIIKAIKVGRAWKVTKEALEQYLKIKRWKVVRKW